MASCQKSKEERNVKEVDICVYGGTASGVIAAYSAKKMGKSVLLIEPGKYLGGMTTGGLGYTDIGNKFAVTGLSRLFYRRIGEHYNKLEQWSFPPSVATKEINRFINDGDVDVLYNHRITGADKSGTRIISIVLENSGNPQALPVIIRAKQFIDCSYEGDLMARSNVSYFTGREDNARFDETLNGVQLLDQHQFPDGIDPYIIEGVPESGLCWGISEDTLLPDGTGDKSIQAYNFRLCLTNNPDNLCPFEKPVRYDPAKYELLARAVKKMPLDIHQYLLINRNMPDAKHDVNNCGPLSTDMIGMNFHYPEADYATREKIWQEHVDYTKGLLYFMANDEKIPETLRNQVRQWGWAKDEFTGNDNFPTQLYVREARRLHGEYIMTQHNCQGHETVGDGVGMAAYGMDSHNCRRIVVNGMVKNEGDVQYHGFAPYPVSYRSLTPRREECTNLLVPVCMSATHIAYGSIRMEPVFMVLGQSAAIAASLAIDQNSTVQEVDVTALRKILKNNPYLDGTVPEILVDDTDIDKVKRSGDWKKSFGGHYKTSFVYSPNQANNNKYSFHPHIKEPGKYTVYFYCTGLAEKELPDVLYLDIHHAGGSDTVAVNPKKDKGGWAQLGSYNFSGEAVITVNGEKTKGPVYADAILLIPFAVN